MANNTALVTGSAGLIGSETVKFLIDHDFQVVGIDNNMRAYFFGQDADTSHQTKKQQQDFTTSFEHYQVDIRDYAALEHIFSTYSFDIIVHAAAQPSHDWSAKEPLTDFSINATATLNLLELTRKFSPNAVFIFTSTNKVYGDRPNDLPIIELATRYDLAKSHPSYDGINETMSIDQSKHSLFGVSKLAADSMVQEYGRYFGLKTGVFRGGCLTGPSHAGAVQHGFLAYLVKAIIQQIPYTIYGYKGKQVRDNIHAHDLVNAFYQFYLQPKSGEVYNMGGSRHSNTSIIEAVSLIEAISGKKGRISFSKSHRKGDHIWYISDVSKFKKDYPDWQYEYSLEKTIEEICRVYV